jgi:exo-1,4-beta-D-glucosaminidase
MEPVHVQYSYDDNSVAVVNSTYDEVRDAKVSAKLYSLDAKERGAREVRMNIAADSSTKAFDLPEVEDLTRTYFLRLQLHDSSGKLLSDNFYWLSTKPDVMDWEHKQDTVYTPQAEFGDLSGLNTLPQVKLDVTSTKENKGGGSGVRISVRNPSGSIAFMVHLRVTNRNGEDVTQILWSDNYFSLLPGEQRDITSRYDTSDLTGGAAVLKIDGYNIAPQSFEVR